MVVNASIGGGTIGREGVPVEVTGRLIYLNDPVKNSLQKYLHNGISTAKYNIFTFIPKFLKEQFSKAANLFFLFTACIQVRIEQKT